jgi:hypothetical protein
MVGSADAGEAKENSKTQIRQRITSTPSGVVILQALASSAEPCHMRQGRIRGAGNAVKRVRGVYTVNSKGQRQ